MVRKQLGQVLVKPGEVPTGKVPSRVVRPADPRSIITPGRAPTLRGGGGGPGPGAIQTQQQRLQEAQDNQTRNKLRTELNQAKNQAIKKLRQGFQEKIRTFKDRTQRLAALRSLNKNISNVTAQAADKSQLLNRTTGADLQKFKVESVADLPQSKFESAVSRGKAFLLKKERQILKKEPGELPFEFATRAIPETAGQIARGAARVTGLEDVEVTFPGAEVPQRRTRIDPGFKTPAITTTPEFKTTVGEFAQSSAEGVTALGQFAIPVLGQSLFLGSLLERPVLAPAKFKEELKKDPVKTSVLFGLGLLSIGGVGARGLSRAERLKLQRNFKNAKTNFLARADDETIQILAATNVKGAPIFTESEIKILSRKGKSSLGRTRALSVQLLPKNRVQAILEQGGVLSTEVKGVVKRRGPSKVGTLLGEKVKVSDIETIKASPFISRGGATSKLTVTFDTKKGFNIKDGQLVSLGKNIEAELVTNPNIVKNQVVGIVEASEAQNLFRITAGSPKLRIYKKGGVSYVFDPRIEGWLQIKPGKAFSPPSEFVIRQVQEQIPAIRAAALTSVQKQQQRLAAQAAKFKRVGKIKTTIGGSVSLETVKKTKTTLSGVPTLAELKKQKTSPSQVQRLKPAISGVQKPKLKSLSQVSQLNIQKEKQRSAQRRLTSLRSRQVQQERNQQRQLSLLISRQAQSQNEAERQRFRSAIRFKVKQIQKLKSNNRKLLLKFKARLPKLKKKILLPGDKPLLKKKKVLKKMPKPISGFDVFVRKKGKDIKFKTFKTKKKARTALKRRLSTTLRASGFIVDKKTKRRLTPKPTSGFTTSKTRKNVLVEKRGRRLDTGKEVKSIQAARRAKKPFAKKIKPMIRRKRK